MDSKPIHLAGASLGGALTILFAIQHTQLLDRITLICPAGELLNGAG